MFGSDVTVVKIPTKISFGRDVTVVTIATEIAFGRDVTVVTIATDIVFGRDVTVMTIVTDIVFGRDVTEVTIAAEIVFVSDVTVVTVGGGGGCKLEGIFARGVGGDFFKPTPIIYLVFKKKYLFIILIERNVYIFIYCSLIFRYPLYCL